MNKKGLITGIAGQDGAYLAKFLLDKRYEMFRILVDYNEVISYMKSSKVHAGILKTKRWEHAYQ